MLTSKVLACMMQGTRWAGVARITLSNCHEAMPTPSYHTCLDPFPSHITAE